MKFESPLQEGRLLRRYKRFLADIELPCGGQVTVHCPNTGSMKNCVVPGSRCWFSTSSSKTRKYPHTWEIATTEAGDLVGIHTGRANALIREAITAGIITELAGYSSVRAEVRYGSEKSRVDFLLSDSQGDCYLEVKSVTLAEQGQGFFPDAVTSRGARHLRELAEMARQGHRAVLLFCVQHNGIHTVAPADHIDLAYGQALRMAMAMGVEVIAYAVDINPTGLQVTRPLPVVVKDLPVR